MATTDGSDETKPLPVSEHDKLGPLGAKPSALSDPADLRIKLLGEAAARAAA